MCAPKCNYVHYMYAGVPHRGQKSALDSLEPPIVSSPNPQAIAPASNRSSYMAILWPDQGQYAAPWSLGSYNADMIRLDS